LREDTVEKSLCLRRLRSFDELFGIWEYEVFNMTEEVGGDLVVAGLVGKVSFVGSSG
jgi:hypothetical protein